MNRVRKLLFYALGILAVAVAVQQYIEIKQMPTRFELSGKIDECCCDAELILDVNQKVADIAMNLTNTLFFKIFRVNLFNECPYWVRESMCTSPLGKCTICECDEHEVPFPWRQDKTSLANTLKEDIFYQWETNKQKSIEWHAEEKSNEQGIYIDLKKNPEVYTGYQGQKIWTVIYGENCFKGTWSNMCKEERLLNRIISGLHTSISVQLCEYYIDEQKNLTHPNVEYFFEKVGDHPEYMKNLYFAHSVMLRAINRAHDHIQNYNYDTGNLPEDIETRRLISELYAITLENCDQPFDEKELFADLSRAEVNRNFISYFHNISRIMDCVECETCKVYGKLQTYGIAAALKILFAEKFTGEREIHLKRNELIALMVTFTKFSSSIAIIDKMFERRQQGYLTLYKDFVIAILIFVLGTWVLIKIYNEKNKKLRSQLRENFHMYNQLEGKSHTD